jgi:putative FmdB family regulatory protein
MPLYEYQCASCKKTHEVMQKFSDPPLDKCPECGGPVAKLMSLSSFALKGAGWYTTDYKKSGPKPAEAKPTKKGGD